MILAARSRSYQEGHLSLRKDAAVASFYYAKISGCTCKTLSAGQLAAAAEWPQAHPLQQNARVRRIRVVDSGCDCETET
jgi:hypothetical protein